MTARCETAAPLVLAGRLRRSRSGCGRGGRLGGWSGGRRSSSGWRRCPGGGRPSGSRRRSRGPEASLVLGAIRRAIGLRRWRAAGHRARLRRHHRAHVLGGVRKQRHVTRALERRREHPLVLGARAALAARVDLATLADVAADATDLLVVDLLHLVDAERTDLATRPAPATAASSAVAAVAAVTAAVAIAVVPSRSAERRTGRAGARRRSFRTHALTPFHVLQMSRGRPATSEAIWAAPCRSAGQRTRRQNGISSGSNVPASFAAAGGVAPAMPPSRSRRESRTRKSFATISTDVRSWPSRSCHLRV